MRKRLLFLFVATAVFASAQTVLDEAQTAAVLEKLAQKNAAIQTIQCEFVQTNHVAVLTNDVQQKGHFYFQHPDKVCMVYSQPQGDMMLMDGDLLKMVSGGKVSTVSAKSNPMAGQMQNMLTACLSGDLARLKNKRSAISCTESATEYQFTILSTDRQNPYCQIVMNFSKSDLALTMLQLIERNGNFIKYNFVKTVFNQKIAAGVFEP